MTYLIFILIYLFLGNEIETTDVHLSFGRRAGCIGSGACAIETPESYHKSTYDAIGTIEVINNDLILKINKSSISVADAKAQFKQNIFTMEEELPLSENLSRAIGVDQNRKISIGNYTVIESKNFHKITFTK